MILKPRFRNDDDVSGLDIAIGFYITFLEEIV